MNRIAVISDIHGNVPALEAVLQDIHRRGIQEIFCLGDLVGKGPESKRAIHLIQKSCTVVVKGNWDDFITKETEFDAIRWHQAQLTKEDNAYLMSLPFQVEFMMSGKKVRLFHASPFSIYKRIQPWDPIEKRLSMFENTAETGNEGGEPIVVGYGDVHNAYVQNFLGKTLFNTGSVGNPLEITQASYAILEGEYHAAEQGPFSIQLVRVPYDIEMSIQIAREMKMPDLDQYIQELTTAKYRGIKG
ncbi:metallophosphoesterase family protein [Metabacillus arenae]|uniref:Metallophosphoesterase family protein n=1 Tax=Metabacillus arenae TaxID=2771434 RepID=A0A926RXQ3_9BACI|nr:metallophosphoesterase family protein [Metabacillus arenae]MBD1380387.1 metallophosphoesterase family protein [Metabacillus arenae]